MMSMTRTFSRFVLGALLGLATLGTGAAQTLGGSPPVSTMVPNVGAPPSSNDIAEDDSSLVYVANGGGVLVFDGEIWQTVKLPNGDAAYSLMFDGRKRVYVGGHNLFGYLERDETGQPTFHDLTAGFSALLAGDSFGDINSIRVATDGVFFQAPTHVFRFVPDSGEMQLWRHSGRFGALDLVQGDLMLQFRGEGLRHFVQGDWQPVKGTAGLSFLTNALLPLPGGAILSMSADKQWRVFVDGRVTDYHMPAKFPSASAINAATVLRDGSLALAGIDGALWLYDPGTGHSQSMHVSDGPLNQLTIANDGGLLALSDLAVYHIDWPGNWTSLSRHDGIIGRINRIRSWGHRWITMSNSGVYGSTAGPDGVAVFKQLTYTNYDTYDLVVADAHHALLAENFRLLWVDETRVLHPIGRADLYPRVLVRSVAHPDQIYVGTEYGVALLDASKKDWKIRIDRGNNDERVTTVVEVGPTEVLVGTSRSGVHLVEFDEARLHVVSDRLLTDADGIRYGKIARAAVSCLVDGTVVASTETGVYRWGSKRFESVVLPGLELPATSAPVLTFDAGPGGEWAFGGEHIYHRAAGDAWHPEDIGNIVNGYVQSIAFDGNRATLFGEDNAILLYQEANHPRGPVAARVQVRTIKEVGPDSLERPLSLNPVQPLNVADDFSISFHFALPEFSGRQAVYQVRLKGRDEAFSNWRTSNTYIYRHLPAGEYTFQVAARDGQGRVSETVPFHFVVMAPWYASTSAKAGWAFLTLLVLAALGYAAIWWRTLWLTRKRVELERVVTDRTLELVTANDRLNDLAHRDILTGLANRALFERRLEQARASAMRHNTRFAVLFIDLDQFKTVNDSLGHEAGDQLLKQVSARLETRLRRDDTLARWGGDEFMVLAEDLSSEADVAVIAQALLEAASAPTLLTGGTVTLSTSVGVSMFPDDSGNINELIRNADTAMYSAKKRGGNQWSFYASEMTALARERLEILNGLRLAVDQGDFVLHYQPIVQVSTGDIVGAEALIRWQKAPGQMVSPDTFISVAESTDLIVTIGSWVIRTACREARQWMIEDPAFTLAINISPRQLRGFELVRVVESTLSEHGIRPQQLTLEVTESSIAAAGEEAQSIINQLKDLGVRVAVDDFGTGQSALASLKRFDFDSLKIDRSFIRDIPLNGDDMEIAATIIAMGHTLGLVVIAEGVETEAQLEFLKGCRCDCYQGFLVSPGVTAAVLSEHLHGHPTAMALSA